MTTRSRVFVALCAATLGFLLGIEACVLWRQTVRPPFEPAPLPAPSCECRCICDVGPCPACPGEECGL